MKVTYWEGFDREDRLLYTVEVFGVHCGKYTDRSAAERRARSIRMALLDLLDEVRPEEGRLKRFAQGRS